MIKGFRDIDAFKAFANCGDSANHMRSTRHAPRLGSPAVVSRDILSHLPRRLAACSAVHNSRSSLTCRVDFAFLSGNVSAEFLGYDSASLSHFIMHSFDGNPSFFVNLSEQFTCQKQ